MSKNVIFCYSGTGNCLDMARNIARILGDTDIVMMRAEPVVTDVREAERVGFIFPCYGGGAPEDVLTWAKRIRIGENAYTFGVSQSASYAGTGLAELDKIIPLKYWATVTHQCSCIWLFPHTMMVPPVGAEQAQKRSERLAKQIGANVREKNCSEKKPPRNALNAAENKAWPAIAKKKAAAFSVSEACIGCGQCVKLCPRGNIRLSGGRAVIGTNCAQCLGCLQYCPQSAISLGSITDKREHYHNPNVSAADLMEKLIHVD
ncbi:MAG: EFR1 family ferrodoxin [Oscillospiraceae bacterium]|nr:EFR1 family ferrodoxin [Oscillospiraceae bacterium]